MPLINGIETSWNKMGEVVQLLISLRKQATVQMWFWGGKTTTKTGYFENYVAHGPLGGKPEVTLRVGPEEKYVTLIGRIKSLDYAKNSQWVINFVHRMRVPMTQWQKKCKGNLFRRGAIPFSVEWETNDILRQNAVTLHTNIRSYVEHSPKEFQTKKQVSAEIARWDVDLDKYNRNDWENLEADDRGRYLREERRFLCAYISRVMTHFKQLNGLDSILKAKGKLELEVKEKIKEYKSKSGGRTPTGSSGEPSAGLIQRRQGYGKK